MSKYIITAPDGNKYEVNAPEGATQEQILAYARSKFSAPQETREQIMEESRLRKAKIRNEYRETYPDPIRDVLTDFGQGGIKFSKNLLNKIPGVHIEDDPFADEESKAFLTGQVADPVTMAIGAGTGKFVQLANLIKNPVIQSTIVGNLIKNPVVQSTIGGALGGGVIGGLSEDGSATSGTLEGGMFGLGSPLLGKAIGKSFDLFKGGVSDYRAKGILKAVGLDSPEAIAALEKAKPGLNVAQIINDPTQPKIAALQRYAQEFRGTEAEILRQTQEAARNAAMSKVVGGATSEASIKAQRLRGNALSNDTNPLRITELNAANEANNQLARLTPQLNQKENSIISATRNEASTKGDSLMQARKQADGKPGWLTQGERSAENEVVADTFKHIKQQRRNEASFIEDKIGSLAKHGLTPLKVDSIVGTIDSILSKPGDRATSLVQKVLTGVRTSVKNAARVNGGVLDAYDLHALRKYEVNSVIDDLIKDAGKSDKARASALASQVKDAMDKAIVDAGGNGWKLYLNKYSMGMRSIDKMKMGDKLLKGSDEQLINTTKGNNPDLVEDIFGKGNFEFAGQMGQSSRPFIRAGKELARDKMLSNLVEPGMNEAKQAISKFTFAHKIPNLLNPKITATNMALKGIDNLLNAKTIEKLSNAMYSPQETLRVINSLTTAERNIVLKAMQDPINASIAAGMMTGATQ